MPSARRGSPRISRIAWGEMEIEGLGTGKDWKLWPGGGRIWDWNETGTHHDPGIQPADVDELLDHGCEVVLLSRGQQLRLKTTRATLRVLGDRGITFHTDETKIAVNYYNLLLDQGELVGGLFHSTC